MIIKDRRRINKQILLQPWQATCSDIVRWMEAERNRNLSAHTCKAIV